VVFVNGHGGNVAALGAAVALLRAEGRDVAWSPCLVAGADAHAGHTETSVLLHLSPEDVWLEETVPGNSAPLAELMPALRSGGVAAVSPVGVLGDPTTATADEGARIFAEMVGSCVRRIGAWEPDQRGMLR
jgi:creatinine amidohydrolase